MYIHHVNYLLSKFFARPLSSSAPEPTSLETSALRRNLERKILLAYKILDYFQIAGAHVKWQFVINGR